MKKLNDLKLFFLTLIFSDIESNTPTSKKAYYDLMEAIWKFRDAKKDAFAQKYPNFSPQLKFLKTKGSFLERRLNRDEYSSSVWNSISGVKKRLNYDVF